MGWIGVSVEKMAVKQKINSLEQRLTKITRQLQSIYDSTAFEQQKLGASKTTEMSTIWTTYNDSIDKAKTDNKLFTYKDGILDPSKSDYKKFMEAMTSARTKYLEDQLTKNEEYAAAEQALQDQANALETALELEQEQVQTQLAEARAEYQSLDSAVSTDIQAGAPKYA